MTDTTPEPTAAPPRGRGSSAAATTYAAFALLMSVIAALPLVVILSGASSFIPLPGWFSVVIAFIGVPLASLITAPALRMRGRAGTMARAAGCIDAGALFILAETLFALSMGMAWPLLVIGLGAATAFVIFMGVRTWRKPRPALESEAASRIDRNLTRAIAVTGTGAALVAGFLSMSIVFAIDALSSGQVFGALASAVGVALPAILTIITLVLVLVRRKRRAARTIEETTA
ncbi:MAG: hypothetical protein V4737_01330 [Curtobacterium sp.]